MGESEQPQLTPRVRDHYIIVIPAKQAIQVANVLAVVQHLMPDGIDWPDPNADPWEQLSPDQIKDAHRIMLDALNENWLGHDDTQKGGENS